MLASQDRTAVDVWLRRLDPTGAFTVQQTHALERMLANRRPFRAQEVLVQEGSRSDFAVLVLQGLVARVKETVHGKRQIISILVPGDMCSCGLSLVLPMDYRLVALSDGRLARITAGQIGELQDPHPELMLPLGRSLAEETAITREWVVNIGARAGRVRLAHLLCELYWRLEAVGLVRDQVCDLPIRQQDLADAVGLSPVHVNRMLQAFRREGLIEFAQGKLKVLNYPRLAAAGEFHPEYLQARETAPGSLAWSGWELRIARPADDG